MVISATRNLAKIWKPLMNVGKLLNVNNIAAAGMVATLANNIPMFGMMKQMDTRGK
ncbi:ethanolamine utilization protein EutH, partial [Salmonella enterica]|uniref:ethanolamine utilization protein EutH n=1 Tax=Salmonella enterica TaxID=28901 RepID=UPI00356B64A9